LLVLLAVATVFGGLGAWIAFSYGRFLAYHRHKRLAPPPLPPGALVRYLYGEATAMLTLAWWHIRAAFADGLRTPAGPPTGPPVLCVHGITQNGSNLWGIRRALERRGRPTRAVSMGTFGRPLVAYMPPLERALRDLVASSPEGTIDIVAHSMGGVVLRLVLAAQPELLTHVRRVVTLGSPHAGTASTRGLPLGSSVRHLGRRSDLLARLPGLQPGALTTIAGAPDLLVYPQSTCHLPGARTIDLPGVGHTGLLTRADAIGAVVEAICGDPSD
jgi:hypothetical protein